ncbi:MAG: hypothetical protein ABJ258_00530, partial [Marinomonas sp.]
VLQRPSECKQGAPSFRPLRFQEQRSSKTVHRELMVPAPYCVFPTALPRIRVRGSEETHVTKVPLSVIRQTVPS